LIPGGKMEITRNKIIFEDSNECYFRGCSKAGRHSHNRFDKLGWDLGHPLWRATGRGDELRILGDGKQDAGGTFVPAGRDYYDVPWPACDSEGDSN